MEAAIAEISSYELERGKPMPDSIHAAVQSNLIFELRLRYQQAYRIFSELSLATVTDGTTPDLAIYPAFALDFDNRTARRTDAPLCCIEIQSPSQSIEEMLVKVKIYFQFGVKSCWVVQPAVRGIFVFDTPDHYQFFHGEDTLRDEALALELPLPAVFA
jgi:Uma2 family endonuclease